MDRRLASPTAVTDKHKLAFASHHIGFGAAPPPEAVPLLLDHSVGLERVRWVELVAYLTLDAA